MDPEFFQAFVAENGVKYWDCESLSICGGGLIELQLADEFGKKVFEQTEGEIDMTRRIKIR